MHPPATSMTHDISGNTSERCGCSIGVSRHGQLLGVRAYHVLLKQRTAGTQRPHPGLQESLPDLLHQALHLQRTHSLTALVLQRRQPLLSVWSAPLGEALQTVCSCEENVGAKAYLQHLLCYSVLSFQDQAGEHRDGKPHLCKGAFIQQS